MPIPPNSSVLRAALGTIAVCTLIAGALSAFGSERFGVNLVYSLCIGLLTCASIDVPRRLLWPQGAPALLPVILIVFLAAVAAAVRDDTGRVSLRPKRRKETLAVSRVYAEQFRQM